MPRAVTADQILFEECIYAFREEEGFSNPVFSGESKSYISTSFEIKHAWDLGICTLSPTIEVDLPGPYKSYISTIENPSWVGILNPHLFGIALSAIISFITHKTCNSPRDNVTYGAKELDCLAIARLSLVNPILTAGPGGITTKLSQAKLDVMEKEVREFIKVLHIIEFKKYLIVMQCVRLVHLSILNKRNDFGLAYLLIVSAIESIAQIAIKRDKVKTKHPDEETWEEKVKGDSSLEKLLYSYKQARGKNSYLKERYIKFIVEYSPVANWEDYVPHPRIESIELMKKHGHISPLQEKFLLHEESSFKHPSELDSSIISTILADSYDHRSYFIHRGKQPPHRDPNPTRNRFFQEHWVFDKIGATIEVLPNYQLLLGLSKHSVLNWLNKT